MSGPFYNPSSSGGSISIQSSGVTLGVLNALNFAGAGVSASLLGGVATITIPGGSGGGGSLAPEAPLSGVVDGTNTVFLFAHTPIFTSVDGLVSSNGDGYTLSGNTVTYSVAPQILDGVPQNVRSFYNTGGGGGGGNTRVITPISSNTAASNAASTDYVYVCTGTITLTLPTVVGNVNRYTIINEGVGTVTIAAQAGQNINGYASITVAPNNSSEIITNNEGTPNWRII